MSNLLTSFTPILTVELQEFYDVELDLRERFIELDMGRDVSELASIVLDDISLLGASNLPEGFWNMALDRAQEIYSRLMAIGKPTVSKFPAFPPPHTVHESFPSHGVPSIAIQSRYHKLLQKILLCQPLPKPIKQ